MPFCEFSEEEYLDLVAFELLYRYGESHPHIRPSKNIEDYLEHGLDISRDLTGRDDAPAVRATPESARTPDRFASLFIQYKSPYLVTRRRSPNEGIWDYWQRRYYRYDINGHQHRQLAALEEAVGSAGCVRYLSPCFYTYRSCELLYSMKSVLSWAHAVSPSAVGTKRDVYTYRAPDVKGAAFYKRKKVGVSRLLSDVDGLLVDAPPSDFSGHIGSLWDAVMEAQDISPKPKLSPEYASFGSETVKRFIGPETGRDGSEAARISLSKAIALAKWLKRELNARWLVFHNGGEA